MMKISKGIATALSSVLPAVADVAVLLAGGALLSYGAWLAYKPAGFIVGGALLIAGSVLNSRGAG